MSRKDKTNSQHSNLYTQEANENKPKKKPLLIISLISGIVIATALASSVLTALIMKQGNPLAKIISTPSPTPTVAATPTASPTPTVATTPIASPRPTVAATTTVSPTPTVTTTPIASPTPTVTGTPATVTNNQNLPLNQQSTFLLKTDCQSATPGSSLDSIITKYDNESVTLGREVVPLVALLASNTYYSYIEMNKPVEFTCNLKTGFKELKLAFGVHGGNKYSLPNNKVLFGVFLDGKPAGTKEVVVGAKQELSLNLQGVKNVSLRAECTTERCPGLSFAEMSLR